MRALKTLIKVTLFLVFIVAVGVGVVIPSVYLYTAANLPVTIDSEADVELHLRQSIESERQSLEITKPANRRENVKWPKPDFTTLPKHLIAFYITATGCPDYFRSPREEGFPWNKRLVASMQGRILDGDGACELIFARNIAYRLTMKTPMQMTVGADRIHRFLQKDQLISFDLHSMWFAQDVIGIEKAAKVLMDKPLDQLTISELAELQLAIPPYDYWADIATCKNVGLLRQSRDSLLMQLAQIGHISDEMARTAVSQPVRCQSIKR